MRKNIQPVDANEPDARLLQSFYPEAHELLDSAEDSLLKLLESPDDLDLLNDFFRPIHTLKGGVSYLGLDDIKRLSHSLESALEVLKQNPSSQQLKEQSELLFTSIDGLRELIRAQESGQPSSFSTDHIIKDLETFSEQGASVRAHQRVPSRSGSNPQHIFWNTLQQQIAVINQFLPLALGPGEPPADALHHLARAAQAIVNAAGYMNLTDLEEPAERLCQLLTHDLPLQRLDLVVFNDIIAELTLKVLSGNAIQAPMPLELDPVAEAPIARTSVNLSSTLRVDQRLLDNFMNLVGELIVVRNELLHIERRMSAPDQSSGQGSISKDLKQTQLHLHRVSEDLTNQVMGMRLIPLGTLFKKFQRTVHDLQRTLHKEIQFEMTGDALELDKAIVDGVAEPLLHLIRNAVDHGIESPETREASQKPAAGRLTLRAVRQAHDLLIELEDDGAGIDHERIRSRMVRNGLLSVEAAEQKKREELLASIFLPGLSTAETVTEVSGRGMGLDIVKTRLEAMNGRITVRSEPGKGTCFTLWLPLTMAMMDALLVENADSVYAIPMASVQEIVKEGRENLHSAMGRSLLVRRELTVPVLDLGLLFDTPSQREGSRAADKISILIVKHRQQWAGIQIDQVLRKEQIIVKPLPSGLAGIPFVSGAAILGDGRAILILDPQQLIQAA